MGTVNENIMESLSSYEANGKEKVTKKIGFNWQDNALHMLFKIWYISLPFSAKQQREMTKFKGYGEREHTTTNSKFSI